VLIVEFFAEAPDEAVAALQPADRVLDVRHDAELLAVQSVDHIAFVWLMCLPLLVAFDRHEVSPLVWNGRSVDSAGIATARSCRSTGRTIETSNVAVLLPSLPYVTYDGECRAAERPLIFWQQTGYALASTSDAYSCVAV
jgi:hypothetical protein